MDIKEILASVKLEGEKARLNIYGDIVGSEWDKWSDEDICPGFVSDFLSAAEGKSLEVHINSGGGDAFAGVAIYNILKARKGETTVYVDALAASAASVIAFAGDCIVMPLGSMLMIHEPWSVCMGNAADFRKEAQVLEGISANMAEIYAARMRGKPEAALEYTKGLMANETWLGAKDADSIFDGIIAEENMKACACIKGESMAHYKLPKGLIVKEAEGDTLKGDVGQGPMSPVEAAAEAQEDEKKKLMLMEIEIEAELC